MTRRFTPLFVVVFISLHLHAQLILNELSSRGAIPDETGVLSDWIEIYNNGVADINLDNYALSDDALNLSKWRFPNTMLGAGQYYLVLANGTGVTNTINHWETAVNSSDTWRYFVGLSEPDALWKNVAYDDAAWSSGPGGMGYGDGDDGTTISSTTSVYLRRTFYVDDTAAIETLLLNMDYDDGFVAYLNGVEIARANVLGAPPAFDALTVTDHEAGVYVGAPEAFSAPFNIHSILLPGQNTLAIQVHNSSAFSSDMSSNAWLSFAIRTPAVYFGPTPAWFPAITYFTHTNFKLTDTGETVYLSDLVGNIIDSKYSGIVALGNSIARIPDGGLWCITATTTPETTNNAATCSGGYEPEPVFSLSAGFYSGSQTVSISSPSPTSIIHYTTDGSAVTALSPLYTIPISFDTTSIIAAKCFSSGDKLPGVMKKNTYFIDDNDITLPVISITLDPSSLFNYDTGIYVFGCCYSGDYPYYGANFWQPWYRYAHIEYFDENKVEQFSKDFEIQIHGGWSRAYDQKSFRMNFKSELDGDVNYPLFPNKPFETSINNFNLRNGGQHCDATRIQDQFLGRVMKDTHLDYEDYRPSIVFLNGEYWGEYDIREKADEHYAESNYGIPSENIDLLNGWTTLAGSDTGFYNLYSWLMANTPTTDDFYNYFDARVDIENYVDYFIAEIYYQNVDFGGYYWGVNNIKLWRNREGGKWRHIMYDMDGAMGYFGSTVTDNYINLTRNPSYGSYYSQIFDKVLYNEKFRNYFVNRFADLINTIYQTGNFNAVANDMQNEIYPEMPRHIERWYLPYSMDYWNYCISQMLTYNTNRITPARQQINASFSLDGPKNITLSTLPENAGFIKVSTIIPKPLPWSGVYFDGVPITLTAIPNPGYTFAHWEANTILPAGSDEQTITINMDVDDEFVAVFNGAPATPNITITEVNYNSNKSFNAYDWIELYNNSGVAFDISNWKIENENPANHFEIPTGTILNANQYLVVAENVDSFASIYPDVPNVTGNYLFNFGNAGDDIKLITLSDDTIFSTHYIDSLPWPSGADGTGRTLELTSPAADITLAENWFDGCLLGSPGTAYSPCENDIILSEINYHSSPAADAGDWVELWNTTANDIDISGWHFADSNDTLVYVFQPAFILHANERYVLANSISKFTARHADIENYTGPFLFNLDGGGEELRLLDTHGNVQFSVIYSDVAPWPTEADGLGKTLELLDASGKMNTASNWFAGCPEGSPGEAYNPDCPLSITSIYDIAQVSIYPNPAIGSTTLHIDANNEELKNVRIELLDASGKIITSFTSINQSSIEIKRNTIASGIYYVKCIIGNHVEIKKVVFL